ncbi:MAG: hypothetical protein M1390_00675 [Candidatus Marsarchaeota archaeon]|nr:hypothetical protein [Candidatus Marsarchaeota archaeon]
MRYVIVDTSSILFGLAHRKDVLGIAERSLPGFTPLISSGVIRELRHHSLNKGAKGASARAALSILKLKKIRVDNTSGDVDSWILRKAVSEAGSLVVTNDTPLLRKLRLSGVRVMKLSKSGKLK